MSYRDKEEFVEESVQKQAVQLLQCCANARNMIKR